MTRRLGPGLLQPAAVLVGYVVCSTAFSAGSHDGLLTPDSTPNLGVLVLGITTLALRLTLLFGALPTVGWWVARTVLRARGRPPGPLTRA